MIQPQITSSLWEWPEQTDWLGVHRLELATLRVLLRNLQGFRSLYEDYGVDTITGPDGEEYSLWDLEYLVREGLPLCTKRQQEAVFWCLLMNRKEKDAAVLMGVAETNPVSMYSNKALQRMLDGVESGELPRFSNHLVRNPYV